MPQYTFTHGNHSQQQAGPQVGPLPAPTPRRPSLSTASHLEASSGWRGYDEQRRSVHQRSQSEFGPFAPAPPAGYRPSSSGYTSRDFDNYAPQTYEQHPRQESMFVQQPRLAEENEYYEQPRYPPLPSYNGPPSYTANPFQQPAGPSYPGPIAGARHARHQSTPNAARVVQHRTSPSQGYVNSGLPAGPRHMENYEQRPTSGSAHVRHSSVANTQAHYPHRSVMEDETAKEAYGSRR